MPAPSPGPQVDRIVFLLACAAFASSAALRLVDPMLPALAADFRTTVGGAAIVVTATGLAYGLLQRLFGPLGDHYGKLRVVTFACLASTVGAVACAASPSLDLLALARALSGATAAALIPLSLAWIGDAVSMEHRQATLARFMTGQIRLGGLLLGLAFLILALAAALLLPLAGFVLAQHIKARHRALKRAARGGAA